jgi:hypothetical protein
MYLQLKAGWRYSQPVPAESGLWGMDVSASARRRLARFTGGLAGLVMIASAASCSPPARGHAAGNRAGALPPCKASVLRGHGGRQGENIGAHGDVEITNAGLVACTIHGIPQVEIVGSSGTALAVRQAPPVNPAGDPLVLLPGQRNAALLTVYWANWCGRRPGPLRLRLTLPGSGGALVVPFNGPPDYNYVPGCISPGRASTIAVVSAYSRSSGS